MTEQDAESEISQEPVQTAKKRKARPAGSGKKSRPAGSGKKGRPAPEREPQVSEPDVSEPYVSELDVSEPQVSEPQVSEPQVFEEAEVTAQAVTPTSKSAEPVITDEQLRALSRKHLLMMIRDLELELAQAKKERDSLLIAYKAGLAEKTQATHEAGLAKKTQAA
ncbi:MAG: hypothetical protein FWG03_07575 [Clostridiales bacterium]|nr:hypothetical protein [Clostridiales bacterium]